MPRHRHRAPLRAALAATAAAGLVLTACGGVQTGTGGESGGDYPSGTVEMYVGASAGGSSDLISRAVSKGLSDDLGASFPVINREGANGALAAAEVANAEPGRLEDRHPERVPVHHHPAGRQPRRGHQHRRLRRRQGISRDDSSKLSI